MASSPMHSPGPPGPAARNLQALFNTLASLTGAVQAIARDIQDGIEQLAGSGLNTNVNSEFNGYTNGNGNLVIVNTPNTSDDDDNEEDHVATLLTPFGLGSINNTNATTQPEREITPTVKKLLESLAMLPQSTRDATLRTYFRELNQFTGQLPQDMFPREIAPHREYTEAQERRATDATGSQQPQVQRISNVRIISMWDQPESKDQPALPAASKPIPSAPQSPVRKLKDIGCVETSFQPVATDAAWSHFQAHENPVAAMFVHFLATKIRSPKPVLISDLDASITVIRDWQDEYLVMPAISAPMEIVDGIIHGRLTVEMILEEKKIAGAKRMSAHSFQGLQVGYDEIQDSERTQPPVAGPSTLSAANLRYTPEQAPQAGPSNVPHSPLRPRPTSSSPSQRKESARPYPSTATRATRQPAARSHAPSPHSPAPSRFAQQLAQIEAINKASNARRPSELYQRIVSPIHDRSLQRQGAISQDMFLASDPRYGGMGDLQRVIHARNPPVQTAPGSRVPLQRQYALDQDDVVGLSPGSNLQETILAREQSNVARFRQENDEQAMARAERRNGKKRAREEVEVEVEVKAEEEEEVKVEKPVSEVPASPAKRQKRAAVDATTQPPANTTPVAGPSAAIVALPQSIEQTQLRRSTRTRRAPKPPAPLVAVPAPAAKKPRKKAAGSSSKGKGSNGAA